MRTLREKHRIAAVAMSGFGMRADVDKSKAAGFLSHLVKPITGEELEEAIHAAAETKREWLAEEALAAGEAGE